MVSHFLENVNLEQFRIEECRIMVLQGCFYLQNKAIVHGTKVNQKSEISGGRRKSQNL